MRSATGASRSKIQQDFMSALRELIFAVQATLRLYTLMTRQVSTVYFLVFVVIGLGFVYFLSKPSSSDGLVKVHMLDVGQGDSFLVEGANGTQMLIDGGRDESALIELSKVMPQSDRTIDVIIATHPDADHVGGLSHILQRYKIGIFLSSQVFTDTETFENLYETLDEKKIPAYFVRKGMAINLNDEIGTKFTVLFPDRDTSNWETNSASVVGRLDVKERSILFTGDAPLSVEENIDPNLVDVDILKIGHHGSKTSTGENFLRSTTPVMALISAGVNNRYGHPAPEIVDRLQKFGIKFLSTQEEGTVTLETDGKRWFKK